jgi:GNAT superfamily N-acetyltransferase
VFDSGSGLPVGHAGLRRHGDGDSLEVRKVMVDSDHRGRGISRTLMLELENAAREFGAPSLVLQTGDRQPAAIRLYESVGYRLIPPYPPFELMSNALCYKKVLTHA